MLCPARGDQCLRRVVGRFEQSLCRADDRLSLRRRQRWRFDSCASSSQIAFVRWIGDQADSLRSEIALRTAEFILAMIETWNHVAGPRDDVMDVEGAVDAHSDQPAPAAFNQLGRPRHRTWTTLSTLQPGTHAAPSHVRRRSAPPPKDRARRAALWVDRGRSSSELGDARGRCPEWTADFANGHPL